MPRPIDQRSFTRPCYGSGHIAFPCLAEELENNGGELVIHVVTNPDDATGETIVYGLFYKSADGTIYNVVQPSDLSLKVYTRADRLASAAVLPWA